MALTVTQRQEHPIGNMRRVTARLDPGTATEAWVTGLQRVYACQIVALSVNTAYQITIAENAASGTTGYSFSNPSAPAPGTISLGSLSAGEVYQAEAIGV